MEWQTRNRATGSRSPEGWPTGNDLQNLREIGFQLGVCVIEPAESKIISSRGPEHVEPRVMDVLLVLVERAGHTVSREELIDRVWKTTYVGDEVLSRCISLLRKHLRDDPRHPRYIETIPKKGYRLIATISEIAGDEVEHDTSLHRSPHYDSIAVLPFTNLSDDAEYEYFSDGIAEEILTLLAKISKLKVAARTSAFHFKDQNVDIRLIGERLGVDAVLTGSVRHANSQIRLAVQLLDTSTGYHVWSEIYEKPTTDFYALQVELSEAIISALRSAMSGEGAEVTGKSASVTADFHAYQLYLQGKFHLNRRGEEPIRSSIALFESACAKDPNFIRAYVDLAKAYSVLPFYSGEAVETCFDRANAFATKALALDPHIGEAHTVLAYTGMHLWQWESAEREFQLALEGHSIDPSAHQWYGQFLSMVGEVERSAEQISMAYDIDPVSPAVNERLAFNYLLQGKTELANEQFETAKALGFERTGILEPYLLLLWRMKRIEEMQPLLATTEKSLNLDDDWAETVIHALRRPERCGELLLSLSANRYRRGLPVIFGAAILTEQVDIAFELAQQLVDNRQLNIEAMLISEAREFRRDARFTGLVKRVGLYDYWERTRWPPALTDG